MRYSTSILLTAFSIIACGAAPAPTAPSKPATEEQLEKVCEVWEGAQILLIQTYQQALAETTIEDASKKKKIADTLIACEAQLQKFVADARKEPAKAEAIGEKLGEFWEKQGPVMTGLLTNTEYETIGRRNSAILIQLTALLSTPQEFIESVEKAVSPTPAQKQKFIPAFDHLAKEVTVLTADWEKLEKQADGPKAQTKLKLLERAHQTYPKAMEVRAKIRAALTPEQVKKFDASFTAEAEAPAEDAVPAEDEKPTAPPTK